MITDKKHGICRDSADLPNYQADYFYKLVSDEIFLNMAIDDAVKNLRVTQEDIDESVKSWKESQAKQGWFAGWFY